MRRMFAVFILMMIPLSVLAQTTVKGNTILTMTATDVTTVAGDNECGVAFVQFFRGGTTLLGPQITTPSSGTTYTYVWDTTTVPNGTYQITVRATDKAGLAGACDGTKPNTSAASTVQTVVVANVLIDVTAPTITIGVPLSGSVITRPNQDIRVVAEDATGIAKMEILLNGVLKATQYNDSTLDFKWHTRSYRGKTVEIFATAMDLSGNVAATSRTVRVK